MKPILLLLALATLAAARIGETPAECVKRYGEAVAIDKDDKSMSFKKSGFFLLITFHDGIACQIFVAKNERDILGNFTGMSETELDSILKANAGDGEWVKAKQLFEVNPRWENEKAARVAQYTQPTNALLIITLEKAARDAAAKEAAEKENLEGF